MFQETIIAVSAGAIAGISSTAHCGFMCGPIATCAASASAGKWGWTGYHAGRIAIYVVLGVAAGAVGSRLSQLQVPLVGALAAWGIALFMLTMAVRIWRQNSVDALTEPLVQLRARHPGASRSTSWKSRVSKTPFRLGLLTGALPCGSLWASLLLAGTFGSAWNGAAVMASFAATSAIGLLGISLAVQRVVMSHRPAVIRFAPRVIACLLFAGAVWSAWRPLPKLLDAEESCHTSMTQVPTLR